MRTMQLISVLCLWAAVVSASEPTQYSKDWQTPEALVSAVYESISADPGQNRDWNRFRHLFYANAHFSMAMRSEDFTGILASDVNTMIQHTEDHYKAMGFHEIELGRKTIRHQHFVSVYSTFEIKHRLIDKQAIMRGLNHFQLLNDGTRWWIISNTTVIEDAHFTIPDYAN